MKSFKFSSVKFLFKTTLMLFMFAASFIHSQTDLYWENEDLISSGSIGKFEVFHNSYLMGAAYSDTEKKFALDIKYSIDGYAWSKEITVVKNFFSNNASGVDYSAAVDGSNTLFICYRVNKNQFTLIRMEYPYKEDSQEYITDIKDDKLIFLPKLFIDSGENINLFYASSEENSFIIKYKKIKKTGGILIDELIGSQYKSSLNPVVAEYNKDLYILFQMKDNSIQSGYTYNIVMAAAPVDKGGWKYFPAVVSKGENNQSPNIFIDSGRLHLVWEKEDNNFISHIFYKSIDVTRLNAIDDSGIQVSDKKSEAHSAHTLIFNNSLFVFWYDNVSGNFQNYQAQIINGTALDPELMINKTGRTLENFPFIFKNTVKYIWLQNEKNNSLYMLKTDSSVEAPKVMVYNMPDSHFTNKRSIKIQWNEVYDKSGMKGYRALLTRDKDRHITGDLQMIYSKETSKDYSDLEDGQWYFKIRSYDNAGNESTETTYNFTVDTTPPDPPKFVNMNTDAGGYLPDNSPLIEWTESNKPLSSYRYFYKFFPGSNEAATVSYRDSVKDYDFNYTADKSIKFSNLENGILLFGVQGIDRAGNKSAVNWADFKLDRYISETLINYAASTILPSGSTGLEIYGRGFKADGEISEIYISRTKQPPYDYVLDRSCFDVESDRFIIQTKNIDIREGDYYIGVGHPSRGTFFYGLKTNFSGKWIFYYDRNTSFGFDRIINMDLKPDITKFILISILAIWIVIVLLLSRAAAGTIGEKIYLSRMVKELETARNELAGNEYIERRKIMIKKGLGLTFKYTILILSLVIAVVLATSITLSAIALRNETANLANEMKERANLVMRNYDTTMNDIYTYEKGFTEAVDAAGNTATLPDIGFALFRETGSNTTIIRYGNRSGVFFKGASLKDLSDEEKNKIILQKVFSSETEKFIAGSKTTLNSEMLLMPEFDPSKLSDHYIFVKPIIVKQGENKQYMAEIALGYSFEKILKLIETERLNLVKLALIVTLIAILISIVGSIFLATTTIKPIKKMSSHVNVISLTDDYEKLLGTDNEKIVVNSHDEIGILASSINEMTGKLIEKAKADKQMMLGKEIQKKFIPLEPHETEYIDIFGFYEGAKGVSGDYFDYKKLDEDHYAFIICDVSGKAVPAALIMVQISTLFHSFCSSYDPKRDTTNTVKIVTTINDTVEERGFAGRFAAILVMILNIKTRKAYLTNAGYTKLFIYNSLKQKTEWIQLNDAGAAGAFPSYMLPKPFMQENVQFGKGDIIYLFTDGIEEARNGKTVKGETDDEKMEEFGDGRIISILDKSKGRKPKEMIEQLIDEEEKFRGGFEQYDDLTILGIKLK